VASSGSASRGPPGALRGTGVGSVTLEAVGSQTPGPTTPVSLPLLENGLDFLASAGEHLRGKPSQRELKYALLHLASGIELVLKERLRQHDPALLYQRPEKFDATDFAAGKFQSANAEETIKRLVDLAGVSISDADRTQLYRLREKRNRVEHFSFQDTVEGVLATTARLLGFALDFIASELDSDSLTSDATEELHGIREALPELEAFVSERWKRISKDVTNATTAVVACARCGEKASFLNGGARCRFCGYAVAAKEGAEEYAHAVVGASHYQTVHDGEAWVVSTCPDCERETLVDQRARGDSEPSARWVCFGCGRKWPEDGLWSCAICGQWTSAAEGEMTVCYECFWARVASSD
jgi:ribosomal protein L37E